MSQRVLIITGAKGGAGATTLAIKLVQRFPAAAERMIVDADLSGKRSLAVWYDLSDDLDQARVVGKATVAQATDGPLVMELARTYEDGLVQTSGSVIRALSALSDHALVVVDAPHLFAATVRPFVARATKIVVVTEASTLGVGVAASVLAAMDRAGIPQSRIALVHTEARTKGDMPRSAVEKALGMTVCAELPNERDRRFQNHFDALVTMLASVPIEDHSSLVEQPMFDRRSDFRKASL
jgi:MinD-like ATPase involved in chromosome partitioning or flagellar assembly